MNVKKLSKSTRNDLITYGVIILAFIIIQVLVSTGSMSYKLQGLLVPLCYYIILAVSLNLTVGILGELSLGHAGFMCVGGFSSALFSKLTEETITNEYLRFTLALLIGAAVAAVFGMLIGMSVLRLKGDYLAIVTLAFGEIIKNVLGIVYIGKDSEGLHVALSADKLELGEGGTKIVSGALGISSVPTCSTFTIGIILVLITLVIVLNIVKSRSGRAIMAIRDNRIAAESVGINITKFRLIAFSISAALAGVAGCLYSHNFAQFEASTFSYNMSIDILVFVVLGGIGNIRGSIIAAVVLTLLPEYLRALQDYRMLIYAVVLIGMMIFNSNPKCIEWRKSFAAKRNSKKAKEVA